MLMCVVEKISMILCIFCISYICWYFGCGIYVVVKTMDGIKTGTMKFLRKISSYLLSLLQNILTMCYDEIRIYFSKVISIEVQRKISSVKNQQEKKSMNT